MSELPELPAWQRGYQLDYLRSWTNVFRASDEGFVLGAFTGFKERDVAAALETGTLAARDHPEVGPVAALVRREVRQQRGIKDFTGQVRARMEPGDVAVSRLGCLPGYEEDARALLAAVAHEEIPSRGAMFISIWQESEQHRRILERLPFSLVAVKIPASSELLGIYALVRARSGRQVESEPLPEPETWGLRRLNLEVPADLLAAALGDLERAPAFADHYSSYNKGHSWRSLSLRGFSDDPGFIIKPAEMSKGWRAKHPEALREGCRDTALMRELPAVAELASLVPGEHQRVRLMLLEPGGGELTRHADITDLEAGTGHRKLLRIHLPLVTNPSVQFCSWTLEGEQYARWMQAGEAWYLDTRKPHTAINGGESPRVHLVVDAYSSPELLALLEAGE
jgi:hypothetical protein